MKKIFSILLLTTLAYVPLQAQDDTAAIQGVVIAFFEGLSRLEDEAVSSEVTKDFQLLEDGAVWNLDTLLAHMAPMKSRDIKRVNAFHFITTERQGDMAWLSYENTAHLSLQDKRQTVRWLESAVMKKEGGRWKIRMLHSTRL